eukprot:7438455-Alexandrium_andersonii.AAC.1
MSASLVGSEMCIRDSPWAPPGFPLASPWVLPGFPCLPPVFPIPGFPLGSPWVRPGFALGSPW